MPYATLAAKPEQQLYYENEAGLLPAPTLFLHGNLASTRWFHPAREVWARAARSRNCAGAFMAVDFWGCGRSSAPKQPEEMDVRQLAGDIASLVRQLGLEQVQLVGHSTGGLVAALLLAEAPGLFRSAVLLDPVGPRGLGSIVEMRGVFERMQNDRGFLAQVMASTIHGVNPAWDFFRDAIIPDAERAVRGIGIPVIEALHGLDVCERLATVEQPVLVLHGEYDTLLSRETSEHLALLVKHGQFQLVPGHGHSLNLEASGKFVELVEGFFASPFAQSAW